MTCLASFLVVLDAMIVSVALPAIGSDLGLGATGAPWVVNAYTLLLAGALLLSGRCVDVFGRRRMFLAGSCLFTLASAACGLAGSSTGLLLWRGVQGVGAAAMVPATLAVLTAAYVAPAERARALSSWSAVAALGAVCGPILGGVLTSTLGWRWVFVVNVPLGVLVVLGAVLVVDPAPPPGPRPRLDVLGAVLATTGLTGVVFAVMRSPDAGWQDVTVIGAAAGGVALLVLFGIHQVRWSPDPLVSVALLRTRSVATADTVMLLLGLGFVSSLLILSFVMQYADGYTALQAGLGFLSTGLGLMIGGRTVGAAVGRIGTRWAAAAGCGLGGVGLAWAAVGVAADFPYPASVGAPGFVFGLGAGAAFTPLTLAAVADVAARDHGAVGGLLNTVRQTSGAIGVAVLGAVAIAVAGSGGVRPARTALLQGYGAALATGAALLLIAGVVAAAAMPARSTVATTAARRDAA